MHSLQIHFPKCIGHSEKEKKKGFSIMMKTSQSIILARANNAHESRHLSNYTTGRPQYVIVVNPLSPMSDRDRISPYNINTISTRFGIRIKKNITFGIIS